MYDRDTINLPPEILVQRLQNKMIAFTPMSPTALQFLMFVFSLELFEGKNLIVMSEDALREYSPQLFDMLEGTDYLTVFPDEGDWIRYC